MVKQDHSSLQKQLINRLKGHSFTYRMQHTIKHGDVWIWLTNQPASSKIYWHASAGNCKGMSVCLLGTNWLVSPICGVYRTKCSKTCGKLKRYSHNDESRMASLMWITPDKLYDGFCLLSDIIRSYPLYITEKITHQHLINKSEAMLFLYMSSCQTEWCST